MTRLRDLCRASYADELGESSNFRAFSNLSKARHELRFWLVHLNFNSNNPYGFGRIFLSYDINDGLETPPSGDLAVTLKRRPSHVQNMPRMRGKLNRLHFNF
jgi:hypothetical protein